MVIYYDKATLPVNNENGMNTPEMNTLREPLTRHNEFFERLYEKAFPQVARFISSKNGSFEDAKDIFQDALVIFYEKTTAPDFTIKISEEAYLLGIARHLWLRKWKANHDTVLLNWEKEISIPDDYFPTVNNQRLLTLIERTGTKCMNLLRAFYYEHRALKDIKQLLGYTNEHSTAVQKYKCIEKIRDTLKEKSIAYEDFIE